MEDGPVPMGWSYRSAVVPGTFLLYGQTRAELTDRGVALFRSVGGKNAGRSRRWFVKYIRSLGLEPVRVGFVAIDE